MLTKEQYDKLQSWRPVLDLYARSGEWIGDNGLFDYLEQSGLALEPILRTCNECRAGFLKFTNSLIKHYEDNPEFKKEKEIRDYLKSKNIDY